ncbi:MAG: lysophospholipid acyltransferase family protein [Verrucomicrobiota bacterium]
MSIFLGRIYFVFVYRLSWFFFAIGGTFFSVFVWAPMLILPKRERLGVLVRRQLQFLFKAWVEWMHFTGVARIEFDGFDKNFAPGTIFIANHPSLLDATFLLARLPDTICIFKPLLMKNPVTGPAAVMAGFVSAASGVDLIREATKKLKSGPSLLVFPEGTRTSPGESLGKLKAGFAMIADRAQSPVQLILIRTSPDLARRGRFWWVAPKELPAAFNCSIDRLWLPEATRSVKEFTDEVEAYMQARLDGKPA